MIKTQFNRVLNFLLEKEARLVLKKYKPKVVVISGDGDKAPTKHAVDTALSKLYFVRSIETQSALGILGFEEGEKSLTDWILILTEGVALILLPNHYPDWLIMESEFTKADYVVEVGEPDGLEAKGYEVVYDESGLPKGVTFKVSSGGEEYPVYMKEAIGEAQMSPVLSAFKLAKKLGEHLSVVAKAFEQHEPLRGHMSLVGGLNGSIIVDNSYDSSPEIIQSGLKTFFEINRNKKRIVLLGDMLGLEANSIEEHKKIGQELGDKADIIVTVGLRSRYIAEAVLNNGMDESKVFQFEEAGRAGEFIKDFIEEGDIIYVNGSKDMNMNKVVDIIKKYE